MTDPMHSAQSTPISPTRVAKYVYTLGPLHTVVNADVSVKPYVQPQCAVLVIMHSLVANSPLPEIDTNIWMECVQAHPISMDFKSLTTLESS